MLVGVFLCILWVYPHGVQSPGGKRVTILPENCENFKIFPQRLQPTRKGGTTLC